MVGITDPETDGASVENFMLGSLSFGKADTSHLAFASREITFPGFLRLRPSSTGGIIANS